MNFPKITIITPTFNSEKYLEETILSVITQGYPNLEYIIIDGGSSDASIEIIKKYEANLTYWISEKDNGLYDALNKGFKKSTGEIMGWINSDDLLHRKSLFAVAQIFKDTSINWLQGYPTVYNEQGMIVGHSNHIYSKHHFYLKKYLYGEFIQQESTFWSRELWEKAGGYINQELQYAADFELWIRFFQFSELACTNTLLGGYRVRKEQLSRVFYTDYIKECALVLNKEILNKGTKRTIKTIKLTESCIKYFPFLSYLLKKYIHKLYGPKITIQYNFEKNKFLVI